MGGVDGQDPIKSPDANANCQPIQGERAVKWLTRMAQNFDEETLQEQGAISATCPICLESLSAEEEAFLNTCFHRFHFQVLAQVTPPE